MDITTSSRKDKRFTAYFENGLTVHFGQRNPTIGTYIDHGDADIKHNYILRHMNNGEDWANPYTAGALSRWILWGPSPDINVNIRLYKHRFNL